MRRHLIVSLIACCITWQAFTQDKVYARWLIDTLCSPAFHGRGYVDDGIGKAAYFLEKEMARIGLKAIGEGHLQSFFIPINTFPGPVEVRVNGQKLRPGHDFVVSPATPSITGHYKLRHVRPKAIHKRHKHLFKPRENAFTVVPAPGDDKVLRGFSDSLHFMNPFGGIGVVRLNSRKVYWSKSGSMPLATSALIDIHESAWPAKARKLSVNIHSIPQPSYEVHNVFGMVAGTRSSDTLILFTAHYDHLGMMGSETMFPGANDNASGTAMIMDMARYFIQHPPAWSVGFLACTAEESGLHGSEYFASNPLVPLEKIQFVINLDMVGTGSGGIRVVNGTTHPEAFEIMEGINKMDSLLSSVTAGGVSRNSDHYPFHRRGIPAFFIFTRGEEFREYHNLDDRPEDLPLTKYDEVFTILRRFTETLMQP